MEFQIEKKDLLKPLTILQGIAERRSSIPALGNILMESEGNTLLMTTTDLETTISSHISCNIQKEGKICVSARKLYEIIRELPEDEITIQRMENHWAKITCKKAIFNLSGLDPSDFPALQSFSENDLISVTSLDLGEMVEKVIFAASTEESRYSLNGIYLETTPEEQDCMVRMVATDGHRLALIERKGPEFSGMKKGAIIPKRGLNEVKKIVAEYPEGLQVSVTENSLIVKVDLFTAVIRQIDGEFPEYKQVIPKENEKLIRVNKKEFASCLRRVSSIATDRVEGIKFSLRKGVIELHSSSQDVGNATEEFPVAYDGTEVSIGFNARYILDALNAIDDEECVMELKDESNAVLIRPAKEKNPLYVVMPMRI